MMIAFVETEPGKNISLEMESNFDHSRCEANAWVD
jgi:hypothetical protein